MPKFLSTWKIVRLLRHHNVKPLIRNRINAVEAGNYVPIRCLSSIARIDNFYSRDLIHHSRNSFNRYDNLQKRWFLSFGNGEEGSALSKVYEEKLVVGYSPEKLFAVVAAVDLYEDFLPWCQRSEILQHHPNGSFDAELEIGFKFFNESYISHVVLDKPKLVKTTAQSNLFEHLINVWEFRPGPTPETCNLYFLVDFKFRSPLYRQVASMFFREVVSQLVISFTDRCRLLYGPGATIEQRA